MIAVAPCDPRSPERGTTMLLIRNAQMHVLARNTLPSWIAAHLRRFFPDECAALGEEGLDERIADGIGGALSYGFEAPDHIAQYIDLTFTFGPDFDVDPALSWPG